MMDIIGNDSIRQIAYSIVTMHNMSFTVSEILKSNNAVKIWVRDSRSLTMAEFDRSYTTSYQSVIVSPALSYTIFLCYLMLKNVSLKVNQTPFDRLHTRSYSRLPVAVATFCIVSEIKRDIWLKIATFSYPFYTVFQKTCDHIFDDKLNQNCPFTKIFGTRISHRQVFLVFHLTYLVQLLYLGELLRPKYHEFSLKLLLFSRCYNTRVLNTKLSPYYFTYLLFNLWFIREQ